MDSTVNILSSYFPQFVLVDGASINAKTEEASAAHGMYYAPTLTSFTNRYPHRALVLMQLRFDGCLGFPGGEIKRDDASITAGLNREVEEETGCSRTDFKFTDSDFVAAHRCLVSNRLLYFFVKCITTAQFGYIEQCSLSGTDYGHETSGLIRVPCYTLEDGFLGLPALLQNRFAGNAKCQLLIGLFKAGVLCLDELLTALQASPPRDPLCSNNR